MGPIKLPFNGTAAGFKYPPPNPLPNPNQLPADTTALRNAGYREVFLPQAGGVQADTVLYVGVVFSVPVGGGALTLLIPTLDGGLKCEEFARNGLSKVLAVPFTERGLWLFHIDPNLKGDILVGSSL